MAQQIGFIGLGSMGSRMARRLIDHGYSVAVRDVNDAVVAQFRDLPGVTVCDSAREVAATGASPIFLSLTMPAIVEDVVLGKEGIVEAAHGQCVIDLSTIGRKAAVHLAAELPKYGLGFLEAPVSGGSPGAAAGTLSIMVSGPRELFEQHKPLFEVIGKQLFYIGDQAGLASTMKLANNILSINAVLTSAEAMCVAIKAGIKPEVALDVLNASTGRNSATLDKFPRRVRPPKGSATPANPAGGGFGIQTAYKDIKLFLEVAEELGVPTMVTPSTVEAVRFAIASGLGPDSGVLVEMIERWAGVTMRPTPEQESLAPTEFVEAKLNYRKPDLQNGPTADAAARRDPHNVRVYNARPILSNLSLETNGFVLTTHKTAVKNFYDESEVRSVYIPEIEELIKSVTGAERVLTFRWKLRTSNPEKNDPRQEGPAEGVHIDYDRATMFTWLETLLGEEAAARLKNRRLLQINVWRGITPVARKPLALCDARTVSPEDLGSSPIRETVPGLAVGSQVLGKKLAGYNSRYNANHRWYYFPNMQPDEAVIFKLCDSDSSRPHLTCHSAIDDPMTSPDAPHRESFEMRTLAIMPE